MGAVRSNAWIWVFSWMQTTTAFSGGFMYSATASQILASSSGSVENLKVSTHHGCRSQRRQILATVVLPIPSSLASSREDQCVTARRSGGLVSVAATTSFPSTRRGRPERSRSSSASTPTLAYRPRHSSTFGRDTPTRSAISVLLTASAASSTIRALPAKPDLSEGDRSQPPPWPGQRRTQPAAQHESAYSLVSRIDRKVSYDTRH